jgi:microcompartment protein CcmK/EutM
MQLGLVIGSVTATLKHESVRGWKLMIVQPQMADGADA